MADANVQIMGRGKVTQGLRFRLTLTYVVFFTVLLSSLGVFFRQTLQKMHNDRLRDVLTEEWAAVKGYLRIEKGKAYWYYDPEDHEEALIVDRLKQVYLLANARGEVMEMSQRYMTLGTDSPDEIEAALRAREVWKHKTDGMGIPYLIRAGLLQDDNGKSFYVAIGRTTAEGARIVDQFTWYYGLALPLMIIASVLLGWFVAGKALTPVTEVARTAQRITGSNLNARIPLRGANDELDHLIEAFNRMTERLDAAFTQMRQFSTDVSHELRTPLTAIRGQLEVAMLAAETPEQYREAILNALQDVERLSGTIRALLLLSQAESGQLALQRQALDFGEVTRDFVDQFQIPAESAGVRLTAAIPANAWVDADRIQMERLLSNLLSNALKYTPAGGSVHVSVEQRAGMVELRVKDTGIGIPADHLPHIFDRFYRVPQVIEAGQNPERGLGLGLSFVAWIVKAHGGRIDVQSTPGSGTEFSVVLPAGQVRAPAPEPVTVTAG